MERYILQQSSEDPLWWVLTDTVIGIVLKFKEGEFNESQKVTFLYDVKRPNAAEIARAMNDMGDWIDEHHYELLFTSPQTIKEESRAKMGAQLKALRNSKGVTLRQLEKMSGIRNNHIARIEAGKYNVTIDTIAMLVSVLGGELTIK